SGTFTEAEMGTDVFELFQRTLAYVPTRDWTELERHFKSICARRAGTGIAASIMAIDAKPYTQALREHLSTSIDRAMLLKAPGIYVEHDPFNRWSSFFSLLRQLMSSQDPDWLRDSVEHFNGPDFPAFAQIWPHAIDESPANAGTAAFLAARGVAAF